jgi:hypothetical protein
LQANEHALAVHVAIAFATDVLQPRPHPPQFAGSLVGSTQLIPHTIMVVSGQVAMHAYVEPEGAQIGFAPPHAVPQPPQFWGLLGSTHPPSQASCAPGQPLSSPVPGMASSFAALSGPFEPSEWPPPPDDDAVASPHLSPTHLSPSLKELSPEMEAHAPMTNAAAPPVAKPMSHRTLLRMRLFGG